MPLSPSMVDAPTDVSLALEVEGRTTVFESVHHVGENMRAGQVACYSERRMNISRTHSEISHSLRRRFLSHYLTNGPKDTQSMKLPMTNLVGEFLFYSMLCHVTNIS